MNKRSRNVWFWIGLVGVVLTAMGINPEMLTSWGAVKDSLIALISNPYMIGCVVIAVVGVFVDPTTKGLKDKKE
jgi:phi LC3 family holin|nr:MAG TPA: holin [Bacteriophage sp.]